MTPKVTFLRRVTARPTAEEATNVARFLKSLACQAAAEPAAAAGYGLRTFLLSTEREFFKKAKAIFPKFL